MAEELGHGVMKWLNKGLMDSFGALGAASGGSGVSGRVFSVVEILLRAPFTSRTDELQLSVLHTSDGS